MDLQLLIAIAALGVVAGALTTVSGMGGGLVVVFTLSWMVGPKPALAISAAALLCGNLHRASLFRRSVPWPILSRVLAGLLPGALVGALATRGLPDALIRGLMVAVAGLAVVRLVAGARWRVPASALAPAGALIGAVAATAGGAGVLLGPVLLTAGLAGERYLAATAVASVALHAVRVIGYTAIGLFTLAWVPTAAILAVGLLAGNLLGHRVRTWIPPKAAGAIEVVTPLVAAVLAAAGLA